MSKQTEALKLALEALENAQANVGEWWPEAITALREALASQGEALAQERSSDEQPAQQQEPVAYWIPKAEQFCIASPSGRPFAKAWEPLYTSPPTLSLAQRQRSVKPPTDEEIDAEFDAFASEFDHESNEWLDMGIDAYFRAGFRAALGIYAPTELKEKNT